MYVRPVDTSGKEAASGGPWQISTDGGLGMGFWRQDGKEFYYLARSSTTWPPIADSWPST
jgi:hypothetical protein